MKSLITLIAYINDVQARFQDQDSVYLPLNRRVFFIAGTGIMAVLKQVACIYPNISAIDRTLGIPLNRQRPLESRRSLSATIELLETGEGVVIFPEGTYYRGQMGPGQIGMVRFVLSRLKLPFIPVGINYAPGSWRVRARIHFGKAFHPQPALPLEKFFNRLMVEIARLSGLTSN